MKSYFSMYLNILRLILILLRTVTLYECPLSDRLYDHPLYILYMVLFNCLLSKSCIVLITKEVYEQIADKTTRRHQLAKTF